MKVANAPCSWGILEFGMEGNKFTYQQVLEEMSSTGYSGTELGDWGFLPTDPNILKYELQSRNLHLVGAFVPVNFINPDDHQHGLGQALKTAQLLAEAGSDDTFLVLSDDNGKSETRTQNAGRIQPEHRMSAREWEIFIQGVNNIAGKVLEKTGVPSVFHHHCAGYVETPEEIDIFLSLSDPECVGLCFDTGHYAYGGGDPLQALKRYSERIDHIHFKDWDRSISQKAEENNWGYFEAVENGVFCELGKGSIDFEAIIDELKKNNYPDWVVVEQDILPGMGTPRESAERNRRFLKSSGI